jgi:thiamine biosynthesis lipoprotein ApbE
MTTIKLNDRYDVTLAVSGKTAKGYEVEGKIWDRQTGKPTEIQVRGAGRTISSAQAKARDQARQSCPFPEDDE